MLLFRLNYLALVFGKVRHADVLGILDIRTVNRRRSLFHEGPLLTDISGGPTHCLVVLSLPRDGIASLDRHVPIVSHNYARPIGTHINATVVCLLIIFKVKHTLDMGFLGEAGELFTLAPRASINVFCLALIASLVGTTVNRVLIISDILTAIFEVTFLLARTKVWYIGLFRDFLQRSGGALLGLWGESWHHIGNPFPSRGLRRFGRVLFLSCSERILGFEVVEGLCNLDVSLAGEVVLGCIFLSVHVEVVLGFSRPLGINY